MPLCFQALVNSFSKYSKLSMNISFRNTASALSASWDVDLVKQVGEALGEECQAQSINILLGPGVNIKRSVLGGRNFEFFSEDPILSGELGAAYINGVQSKGVGTSLKHYVANNVETRRMHTNSAVDTRTLREIYFEVLREEDEEVVA